MFCPKCGSMLMPKMVDGKKVVACGCGHKGDDTQELAIKSKTIDRTKQIEVVDEDSKADMPTTDEECPKCKHGTAYFWLQQTRASDEPETKFLRCEKCKHTWRDYS